MTDEHGDPEPLTWQEKLQWARMERERLRASQKRTAQRAEGQGLISRLGKRLGVNVGSVIAKPMPQLLEPLDDEETNARARMLAVQAELVKEQHKMTAEQYDQRRKFLEDQKKVLLASYNEGKSDEKGEAGKTQVKTE